MQPRRLLTRRAYNTIIERQTNNISVNMDTTAVVGVLEGLTLTQGLNLGQSLVAIQVGLRLLHEPVKRFAKVSLGRQDIVGSQRRGNYEKVQASLPIVHIQRL